MNLSILGGGIAGIYAALLAIEKGHNVTLIEKEPELGGLCRSVSIDGSYADYGLHVVHTDDKQHVLFFRSLLKDNIIELRTNACSYFDHRFHNFPPNIKEILSLPITERISTLKSLVVGKVRERFGTPKDNFQDELTRIAGEYIYKKYFGGFSQKFWGVDPSTLSSQWVPRRVIPRFFGRDAQANQWQAYPKNGGFNAIVESMEALIDKKCTILKENEVKGFSIKDGRAVEVLTNKMVIKCDHIISTIPLMELRRILDMPADLSYRSMVFVFISLKADRLLQSSMTFFPEKEPPFTRAFNQKMLSFKNNVITMEIPCYFGDETWNDLDIHQRAVNFLIEEGLLEDGDIIRAVSARSRHAYPIHNLEYYQKIDNYRTHGVKNLLLSGRMGMFTYSDITQVMDMSRDAVNALDNQMA